jgi:hypothetical protein
MWRDLTTEREQLDGLAAELAEAGRIARAATSRGEVADPRFAAMLRASLAGQMPQLRTVDGLAPVPPTRPLGWAEGQERRAAGRPLAGGRREWVARDEDLTADGVAPRTARPQSGRRWDDPQPAEFGYAPPAEEAAPDTGHVAMLKPSVRWQVPVRVMPARWVAVGLAASLAIASLMYGTVSIFPSGPTATAEIAINATLTRGGSTSPLATGAELKAGDQVAVEPGGQATIVVGGSYMRMAPGSEVRLDGLDPNHVVVDQLDGRVYHRVDVDEGGRYTVATATVTWTATGTAFDIDRHAWGADGEEVRGLALLDGLGLTGPEVDASLRQGQSATVILSGAGVPDGSASVAAITGDTLADAWLIQNAQLDRLAGLDLGELASLLTPSPEITPTIGPVPTEPPPAQPTPKPTPAGPINLGSLSVSYDSGSGQYAFSWAKYTGTWNAGSTYYKLLYAPWGTTPSYGSSDYWACLDSRYTHSWTGEIAPGDYAVRVQVVDETSGVVVRAQTGVFHLKTLPPTQSLGSLNVDASVAGQVTFSWSGYSGGWPFNYYKFVYGPKGSNPSYLAGAGYFAAIGPEGTSVTLYIGEGDFTPGTELDLRIQAIGYPYDSGYVFGQTNVLTYTVPSE